MKTYSKRVAFLLSDQHFVPHGGIGQFSKGFAEMCQRLNWKVDIILDKAPSNTGFKTLVELAGANIIWPLKSLRYTDHVATFAFSDTINFEKIINFRNALVEAFEENIYDLIVCNTQEAMTAVYAMTISRYIPVVFYTHLHSMIFRESQGTDVFLDSYHTFYNKHMEFTDIIVGTQSQKNIDELTKNGVNTGMILRMPMSERNLLTPALGVRKGVLFIGRWEDGKNPEAYINVMKECRLPCKVMTNSSGSKKFEKAFNDAGITEYEIRVGITGQEKVDFIKSSRTFFMPSLRENYPFAFLECLGHMPCIVLDRQDWSTNFDKQYFKVVSNSNASAAIREAYEQMYPDAYYATGALDYIKGLDDGVDNGWRALLDSFEGKQSNTNVAKINSYQSVNYNDYIRELDRSHLAREDFESVLANKHKFRVVYTDTNTYLTTDPTFEPKESDTGLNLFEGL